MNTGKAMTPLEEAAERAGLTDPELLNVARTDIEPSAAIADLRRQFPGDFAPVFDARTASKAERDAWMSRYRSEQISKRYQQIDNATLERAQVKYGENGDKR